MTIAALTRVERDAQNDSVDVARDCWRQLGRAYAAVRVAVEEGRPKCVLSLLAEDLALSLETWRTAVRRCRALGVEAHADPVVATMTGGTR